MSAVKRNVTKGAGLAALIAAAGAILTALTDDNPATQPDWGSLVPAIIAAIGVMFARPNKVTSEEAGATKP